jgi:hypothetical protein
LGGEFPLGAKAATIFLDCPDGLKAVLFKAHGVELRCEADGVVEKQIPALLAALACRK